MSYSNGQDECNSFPFAVSERHPHCMEQQGDPAMQSIHSTQHSTLDALSPALRWFGRAYTTVRSPPPENCSNSMTMRSGT